MDINFAPPQELVELAEKTKAFVVDKVIPYEKDPRWTSHGPTDELRIELNTLAKAAGVFAPHVGRTVAAFARLAQHIAMHAVRSRRFERGHSGGYAPTQRPHATQGCPRVALVDPGRQRGVQRVLT